MTSSPMQDLWREEKKQTKTSLTIIIKASPSYEEYKILIDRENKISLSKILEREGEREREREIGGEKIEREKYQ